MNINEIPQELMKLHTALTEKIGNQCLAPDFNIGAIDQGAFHVSLWGWPNNGASGLKQIRGNSAEEAFTAAWQGINDLPSVAEQQLAEFQGDLAKLIDKGRDYNIDLDIVNPLIATSKKLAENAITKQDVVE